MSLIKKFIPFSVSIGIIGYILHTFVSLDEFRSVISTLSYPYLFTAIGIVILTNFLLVLRWYMLLSLSGYTIPYKRLTKVFVANLPIAKFTPGYTGDFLRSFFLRKEVPVHAHLGVLFYEALCDITTLTIIACIGSYIIHNVQFSLATGWIFISLVTILIVIIRIPRALPVALQEKAYSFAYTTRISIEQPQKSIPILLLTFCISLLSVLYVYILFFAIGAQVPLTQVLTVQPLVMMITLIPISFWGIGVREAAMLILYTGVASEHLVSTGLLYAFIGSILLPLLCIPYTYATIRNTLSTLKQEH